MNSKYAMNFVEGLALEEAPKIEPVRGTEALAAAAVTFGNGQQAVAVGSQIAEFASNVPSEIRGAISNSVLLAQLAANKAVQTSNGTAAAWREAYRNVLLNTGWVFEGSMVSMQEIKQNGLEVHKAIIPVLTAILGPAVAAAALVTTILNGLAEMDKNTPWITLFNRESRRAKVNQFQIGYVHAPDGKAPRMTLMFFELDVTGEVTQVLFFKLSKAKATLLHSQTDLSVNTSIFADIQDSIRKKVAVHATTFIQEIEV